jgi:hypothetical protein
LLPHCLAFHKDGIDHQSDALLFDELLFPTNFLLATLDTLARSHIPLEEARYIFLSPSFRKIHYYLEQQRRGN